MSSTYEDGHPIGLPVRLSTYTNHRCRCTGCTALMAAYQRARRARLRAKQEQEA